MSANNQSQESRSSRASELERDVDVIESLRKADRSWLDNWIEQYYKRLIAFAYRLVNDPDDAQEVVQEALLRFLSKAYQLERETLFQLICGFVKNVALETIRKRYRNRHTSHLAGDKSNDSEFDPLENIGSEEPTPDQEMIAKELENASKKTEAPSKKNRLSLTPEENIVLQAYAEGKDYSAISEMMGITNNHARQLLWRARNKKLRELKASGHLDQKYERPKLRDTPARNSTNISKQQL